MCFFLILGPNRLYGLCTVTMEIIECVSAKNTKMLFYSLIFIIVVCLKQMWSKCVLYILYTGIPWRKWIALECEYLRWLDRKFKWCANACFEISTCFLFLFWLESLLFMDARLILFDENPTAVVCDYYDFHFMPRYQMPGDIKIFLLKFPEECVSAKYCRSFNAYLQFPFG